MGALSIVHLCSARHFVGEAARVVDLAEAQRDAGHAVLVIGRAGYSVVAEAAARGLPHHALALGSRFHPWRDRADRRALGRILRERAADILHVHRGKEHWLAAWTPRPRGCTLVRTRHVVTPVRGHVCNRWLYGRATDALICASRAAEAGVRSGVPRLAIPVRVVHGAARAIDLPPPARAEALRRRLHLEGALVTTLLGRIDAVKGHAYGLEALAHVAHRHPEVALLFAYPRQSEYRLELEAAIARLGLGRRIRWLGPQADLGPLLAITDLGLIASIGSEGWSRVAVEFAHAGRAVIASTVGSLPEIVRDGETGVLVPPADAEALARAWEELAADPERRAHLAEGARSAVGHFRVGRVATEVESVYREALARLQ